MKSLFLLTLVGLALQDGTATPATSFARETGKFSLNLYKNVADTDENVVISPVSVQTALGLAYMGADGSTAAEMANVMHLDKDRNSVGDSYKALLDNHARSDAVKIANKIFLDKKFTPTPEFSELVSSKFYSSAETLDTSDATGAARTINSWVESATNNKIQELVTSKQVENSTSLLVNAVYFKADWRSQFSKRQTTEKDFWTSGKTSKKVDMMRQKSFFPYGEFDGFKAVSLPYKNADFSLVVVLPNEREGLRSVEANIEQMDVKLLLDTLKKAEVRLAMPKFKTEFKAELKQTLVNMGMSTVFTPAADFSKLSTTKVFVADVIHKAVLEVDEKGTEAAASTAVRMPVGAAPGPPPPPPKDFTVDHPFLYLLVDSEGHIFFMGRYVK